MKIPKNKGLVRVYWHDHTSNDNWLNMKEIKKFAEDSYGQLCETIGECIIQNSKYIVINAEKLPDKDTDEVLYGLSTMILKKDIEKIVKI